jgi:hypothetical protein
MRIHRRLALAGLVTTAALAPATADAAPTAQFSVSPSAPQAGQKVAFAASNGCDRRPCTYNWTDLGPDGPGGADWPLGTGSSLSFVFSQAGNKWVQLTVRNARGQTAQTTKTIKVAASGTTPPPTETTPPPTETTPPPTETTPPPSGCVVTSAAQMQARAADSAGQVCTVTGPIGSVTLNARPAQNVTFRGDGSASFANVIFDGAANITLDRARVTGSIAFPDRTGRAHGSDITLSNLVVGGTSTARTMPGALLAIAGGNDRITLQRSELAWTNAGNTGNAGYAIRAVNGNGDVIDGLNVLNNKIHHIGADAMQLAGVAALRVERNDISYVAAEQGSSEHSDSLQIMSLAGTTQARILRNAIHHVGYYDGSHKPGDGYPAGQLLVHGWSDVPVLFQDNLLRENRNYSPMFKDESNGAVADNWTFDHNTIIRQGPPQPSANRSGFFRGRHVLTNNILSSIEGPATWTSASGNVVEKGKVPGGTTDKDLRFDANYRSTDHPDAGIRQVAGPDW